MSHFLANNKSIILLVSIIVLAFSLDALNNYQISSQRLERVIDDSHLVLSSQNIPAFPGAEGFGSTTVGGRGGQVIKVTNLNDSGAGSFRAAIQATGPRIVVFDIGGVITLNSDLVISSPYITIAGQTAPGNGIVIKRGTLDIQTHNVIVRGIKARVGDDAGGPAGTTRDGITIGPPWNNPSSAAVYNVIVDHSSISWGIDENMGTWTDSASHSNVVHDVTFQWNIISEALYDSIHIDEGSSTPAPHSMGVMLGRNATKISMHHNLLAHNDDRNPRFAGVINGELINNLIYDWGSGPTKFSDDKSVVHIINNYYKAGANSRRAEIQFGSSTTFNTETGVNSYIHQETRVYLSGNLTSDPRDGNPAVMAARAQYAESRFIAGSEQFVSSGITTHTAPSAYDLVINNAGASYPTRDSIDQRIVSQVLNRSGQIIDSQNQVGGWSIYTTATRPADFDPDNDGMANSWEALYGLNGIANDANSDSDGDGYSNIEEYINSLIVMPYGDQNPPMPIYVAPPVDEDDQNEESSNSTEVGSGDSTGSSSSSDGNSSQEAEEEGTGDSVGDSNSEDNNANNPDSVSCKSVELSGSIIPGSGVSVNSLNGISVTVDKSNSEAIYRTISDNNGNWKILLCEGSYTVSVDSTTLPDGLKLNNDVTILLSEEKNAPIELRLVNSSRLEEIEKAIGEATKQHKTTLNIVGTVLLSLSVLGFLTAWIYNNQKQKAVHISQHTENSITPAGVNNQQSISNPQQTTPPPPVSI